MLEGEGDWDAECYMQYLNLGVGHLRLQNPDLQHYAEEFGPPIPPQGAGKPWEAENRGGPESALGASVSWSREEAGSREVAPGETDTRLRGTAAGLGTPMSLVTRAGGGGGGTYLWTTGTGTTPETPTAPAPGVPDFHATSLPSSITGIRLFLSFTPLELTSRFTRNTEAKETSTVEGHYPRVPFLRIHLLAKFSVIPKCIPVALLRAFVDMRRTIKILSCRMHTCSQLRF